MIYAAGSLGAAMGQAAQIGQQSETGSPMRDAFAVAKPGGFPGGGRGGGNPVPGKKVRNGKPVTSADVAKAKGKGGHPAKLGKKGVSVISISLSLADSHRLYTCLIGAFSRTATSSYRMGVWTSLSSKLNSVNLPGSYLARGRIHTQIWWTQ